jgi:hypothetical protein
MVQDITYFLDILPSITQLLKGIRNTNNPKTKKILRKGLRRTLQYSSEDGRYTYSIAAKELCDRKAIDIHKLSRTQPNTKILSSDSPNRPILLLEHPKPLGSFIDELIDTPDDLLLGTLMKYPPLVWITREENNKLNSNGYNRVRPGGWKKCYDECEIILCNQIFPVSL